MPDEEERGERPETKPLSVLTVVAAILATAIFIQSVVAFGILADLFAAVKAPQGGEPSFAGVALRFLHIVGAAYISLLLALVFIRRAHAGTVAVLCALVWTGIALLPEFVWFYDFGRDAALEHWVETAASHVGIWAAALVTFVWPP